LGLKPSRLSHATKGLGIKTTDLSPEPHTILLRGFSSAAWSEMHNIHRFNDKFPGQCPYIPILGIGAIEIPSQDHVLTPTFKPLAVEIAAFLQLMP